MADLKSTIKNKIDQAGKVAEQAIATAKDRVASTADYVVDQSKQAAGAVAQNVTNAGDYLEHQAENTTEAVSGGLKSVARSIRQNTPQDSPLRGTASDVAQSFSNAAGYLDRQGFQGVIEDLATVIKSNPIPSVMLGIGLGFLLGRATQFRG